MTAIKRSALVSFFIMAMAFATSASVDTLPTKTVDGRSYHYYTVQDKETVYGLCQRFGVSREELMATNPSVADGLKSGQVLLFPIGGISVQTGDVKPETYVVKKGDSGYGISHRFNLTLDEFYALNPEARDGVRQGQIVVVGKPKGVQPQSDAKLSADGTYVIGEGETLYRIATEHNVKVADILHLNPDLDPANYKAGTVIMLPQSSNVVDGSGTVPVKNSGELSAGKYKVKQADTFYSVAMAHGLSVEQLQAANPDVYMLQEGMLINIPDACSERSISSEVLTIKPILGDSIKIAVALPFKASNKTRSRQDQLYAEFYKGLLLAVDSLRNIGHPVKIMAFDTEGTTEGVSRVLMDPVLATAQVIVAPDQADQFERFAEYGMAHGINVLNLFVVKSDTYLTNPRVLHATIPHDSMYGKAIEYMVRNSGGSIPVILRRKGGSTDKEEFITMLKKTLDSMGREYKELEFSDKLGVEQLAELDKNSRYAFIPVSSKRDELNYILPALQQLLKDSGYSSNYRLWGYPEWITFRGETLDGMHEVNTYIFSRFYSAVDDAQKDAVEERFSYWYGPKFLPAMPSQGLYGFDCGMYLLKAIAANGGDFNVETPAYEGVQNGFHFRRAGFDGGWINDEMYIINFFPGKMTYKTAL